MCGPCGRHFMYFPTSGCRLQPAEMFLHRLKYFFLYGVFCVYKHFPGSHVSTDSQLHCLRNISNQGASHHWNKWKSESEVAQLCPTLCNPMEGSLSGSAIHGIFHARILEWAAISFSRGSSQPRDRTRVSCVADRRFTVWATREALPPLSWC